jgi:hypothetical protein
MAALPYGRYAIFGFFFLVMLVFPSTMTKILAYISGVIMIWMPKNPIFP